MTSDNPASASARPRRRPGENRERLIEAGLIEFGLFGYHGASTSGIAARAQVPQPHLYASFPSKRELFLATVRRVALQFAERAAGVPGGASAGRPASAPAGSERARGVETSGGRETDLFDGISGVDASARVLLQAVALAGDVHLGAELDRELSTLRSVIGSSAFDQLLLHGSKLLLPEESAGK